MKKKALNQCAIVRQEIASRFINKEFTAESLFSHLNKRGFDITQKHVSDLLRRIKNVKTPSGLDWGNLSYMMSELGVAVDEVRKQGKQIVYVATKTSENLTRFEEIDIPKTKPFTKVISSRLLSESGGRKVYEETIIRIV
jgi:hypothetical protein